MKELKDYLPYYLGCDYWTDNSQGNLNAHTLPNVIDMCKRGKNVQLHLRRLSDMTEQEWNEIEAEVLIPDAWYMDALKDSFEKPQIQENRFGWQLVNSALISLRKRAIDVDGLIDAGLAIDAKTIKQ